MLEGGVLLIHLHADAQHYPARSWPFQQHVRGLYFAAGDEEEAGGARTLGKPRAAVDEHPRQLQAQKARGTRSEPQGVKMRKPTSGTAIAGVGMTGLSRV